MKRKDAFELETAYLARLYEHLDELRDIAKEDLAHYRNEETGGSHQLRSERDALARLIEDRLIRLAAVNENLCFGKIVHQADSEALYVGRLALFDEDGDPLLIDWRAPAAEAFYRATPLAPMGLAYRRHLVLAGRQLIGIEDDLFNIDYDSADSGEELAGSASLLSALSRRRTGRMQDIVPTIQREQDEVIRAPLRGTLVLQGGPGTGKTVVALHRAAYLLYSHRLKIADDGVLIVGPSTLFLRYIEQVLPSLGESAVVLASWTTLLPGFEIHGDDPDDVRILKGSLEMAGVVQRLVRRLERMPKAGITVRDTEGHRHHLSVDQLRRAGAATRGTRKPHNEARQTFVAAVLSELSDQVGPEVDLLPEDTKALGRLWRITTPDRLVRQLYEDERVRAAVCPHLSPEDQQLLAREPEAAWTASDVAILDEARVALGAGVGAARPEARSTTADELRYAQEVIETFRVKGLVPPDYLAERFSDVGMRATVAEQARADPSWKFGHVIVDEAQDLTPMQWRFLGRRAKSLSMTVVGDLDQSRTDDGTTWIERIGGALPTATVTLKTLTVNYRTPEETMSLARRVRSRAADSTEVEQVYVRHGDPPRVEVVEAVTRDIVVGAARRAVSELGDLGRVAIINPPEKDGIEQYLDEISPPAAGTGNSRLDRRVAAFSATEVKGLEFDTAIVCDPEAIYEAGGWRLLYVALSRATDRLAVLLPRRSTEFADRWLRSGNPSRHR